MSILRIRKPQRKAIAKWRQMKSAKPKPLSGWTHIWDIRAMIRGDVWWVDFDPTIGSEIRNRRPAVIISNDTSNNSRSRVQVVPLTTNVSRRYIGETYLTLNGRRNKAMADQIRTVSKLRLSNQFGRLSVRDMRKVESAVRIQFGLM